MRRPLLALALSLSLYGTATAAPIISTLPGDPTTATGITGLEIPGMPGVVYDVDFTRAAEAFNAIFGVGDPPEGFVPLFYDDPSGAAAMAIAIGEALGGSVAVSGVGDEDGSSGFFDVPYRFPGTGGGWPNPEVMISTWTGVLEGDADLPGGYLFEDGFDRTTEETGFGIFTIQPPAPPAVVPEPSSVTLALMGAVGLLGYGWRRKRKRANAVS